MRVRGVFVLVRKLTNDYRDKLENLSDIEIVARFELVMDSFIELYRVYILNSSTRGVYNSLSDWDILRKYRKQEFGYTSLVEQHKLLDDSLNANQLNNPSSLLISNLIYQNVLNKCINIQSNSLDISKELFRYYRPFVFDYIKDYRPHLIQETNNILQNKYRILDNVKIK